MTRSAHISNSRFVEDRRRQGIHLGFDLGPDGDHVANWTLCGLINANVEGWVPTAIHIHNVTCLFCLDLFYAAGLERQDQEVDCPMKKED